MEEAIVRLHGGLQTCELKPPEGRRAGQSSVHPRTAAISLSVGQTSFTNCSNIFGSTEWFGQGKEY